MEQNQNLSIFKVHIRLPETFSGKFVSLIPLQRLRINQLLEKRVILNYALDMNREHLWITMRAETQQKAMDILATFPIIKDVKVEIFELAFSDSAPVGLPELIMN